MGTFLLRRVAGGNVTRCTSCMLKDCNRPQRVSMASKILGLNYSNIWVLKNEVHNC